MATCDIRPGNIFGGFVVEEVQIHDLSTQPAFVSQKIGPSDTETPSCLLKRVTEHQNNKNRRFLFVDGQSCERCGLQMTARLQVIDDEDD
jgi:hypothetical protein